jgi:hypothetical protein
VVTLYLTAEADQPLLQRLGSGLKPGSRVVTYLFSIPGWLPAKQVDLGCLSFEEGKLHLYSIAQAFRDARADRECHSPGVAVSGQLPA